MNSGRFIALEGGEGTGKSTQARLLVNALAAAGIDAVATREPGGTPGAEAIRELLLHPPGEGWTMEAESLLFAAARADHVQRRILPAIADGTWVVCDRFVDSSRAYQGGAGKLGDAAVQAMHEIGSHGLRPDLVILIDADDRLVRERLALRDGTRTDAIGGREADYHAAVRQTFLANARNDQNVAIIDGDSTPEDVHSRIMQVVTRKFGLSS